VLRVTGLIQLIFKEAKMEVKLNEQGQVELTTKVDVQKYISDKLAEINYLQSAIQSMQSELDTKIAELAQLQQ